MATSATSHPPSSKPSTPPGRTLIQGCCRSPSPLASPQNASHSFTSTRSAVRSTPSRLPRPPGPPAPSRPAALPSPRTPHGTEQWLTDNNINNNINPDSPRTTTLHPRSTRGRTGSQNAGASINRSTIQCTASVLPRPCCLRDCRGLGSWLQRAARESDSERSAPASRQLMPSSGSAGGRKPVVSRPRRARTGRVSPADLFDHAGRSRS